MGSTASTICSTSLESWMFAAEIVAASGAPSLSTSRWCLVPALPRSTGLRPVCSPPLSPGRSRNRGPLSTSQCVLSSPVCPARHLQEPSPEARLLPISESPPAGNAASVPEFLRQHLPRYAAPENVDDARKRRPCGHARSTPLRPRRLGWQQLIYESPQFVTNHLLRHLSTSPGTLAWAYGLGQATKGWSALLKRGAWSLLTTREEPDEVVKDRFRCIFLGEMGALGDRLKP